MKNCEITIKNKKMTIEIDLEKAYGDSKSGKTIIIASTEGNVRPDADQPDLMVGLNVYRKKP